MVCLMIGYRETIKIVVRFEFYDLWIVAWDLGYRTPVFIELIAIANRYCQSYIVRDKLKSNTH